MQITVTISGSILTSRYHHYVTTMIIKSSWALYASGRSETLYSAGAAGSGHGSLPAEQQPWYTRATWVCTPSPAQE